MDRTSNSSSVTRQIPMHGSKRHVRIDHVEDLQDLSGPASDARDEVDFAGFAVPEVLVRPELPVARALRPPGQRVPLAAAEVAEIEQPAIVLSMLHDLVGLAGLQGMVRSQAQAVCRFRLRVICRSRHGYDCEERDEGEWMSHEMRVNAVCCYRDFAPIRTNAIRHGASVRTLHAWFVPRWTSTSPCFISTSPSSMTAQTSPARTMA